MFGHFEALHGGVPILMIPFVGDQFRNAKQAQRNGYAKYMNFNKMSTETLVSNVEEMTTNKSYLNKAREMSAIIKDNMNHPLDEAIYWIEHVARFKGARYLKSHAINMSWLSYFSLDVFGVLIFGILSIIFIIYFIIKFILIIILKLIKKQKLKLS